MKRKKIIGILLLASFLIVCVLCIADIPLTGQYHYSYDSLYTKEELSNQWIKSPVDQRHTLLGEIAGQDWDTESRNPPTDPAKVVFHGMSVDEVISLFGNPESHFGESISYRLANIDERDLCDHLADIVFPLDPHASWLLVEFDDNGSFENIFITD